MDGVEGVQSCRTVHETTNQLAVGQYVAEARSRSDEHSELIVLGEKAFNAFTQGITGEEFASSVYMLEPELYNPLAGMGKDQMLTILKTQLAIWSQIAPRAAEVEQFLDAFVAYGQEPGDDEPEQPLGSVS